MAKYKQTKKKYDNKKKTQQSAKLTASQEKQAARTAKKKAEKKREAEKRAKETQRIQGKKERLKKISQQQAKKADYERFKGLLLTMITQGNYNPSKVLNDTTVLKPFLREIGNTYPSLKGIANEFLEATELRLGDGVYRTEAMINKLVKEFKANPYRTTNADNIPYDTGELDINAGAYTEAVYQVFKKEAEEKGISNSAFRRALDYYLANKPYELYEGTVSRNGKISRSRKLKPPREIADMAISRALSLTNVRVVD